MVLAFQPNKSFLLNSPHLISCYQTAHKIFLLDCRTIQTRLRLLTAIIQPKEKLPNWKWQGGSILSRENLSCEQSKNGLNFKQQLSFNKMVFDAKLDQHWTPTRKNNWSFIPKKRSPGHHKVSTSASSKLLLTDVSQRAQCSTMYGNSIITTGGTTNQTNCRVEQRNLTYHKISRISCRHISLSHQWKDPWDQPSCCAGYITHDRPSVCDAGSSWKVQLQ